MKSPFEGRDVGVSREELQRKARRRFGELPKVTEIRTFRDVYVEVGKGYMTDNMYADLGAGLLDAAALPKPRGRPQGSGIKYPTAAEFFEREIQAKLDIADRGHPVTKLSIATEMGLSQGAYHYKSQKFLNERQDNSVSRAGVAERGGSNSSEAGGGW